MFKTIKNSEINVEVKEREEEIRNYPTKVPVYVSTSGRRVSVVMVDSVNFEREKYIFFSSNGYAQTSLSADSLKELFDKLYKDFPDLKILDVDIQATYRK